MAISDKKRLFLLDGTAIAYRSYFAFIRTPLRNSKGINTSGAFGFSNTLLKILRDENPEYIACIFDTSAPTFRHKQYKEYKATREKMPDELLSQLPTIRQIVEAFGIPVIEKEGFEADDIMATLAKKAEAQGFEVFLVTMDKDMAQMVSDQVRIYSLSRGGSGSEIEIFGPEEIKNKWGVSPKQILDLFALMGDSSDNIPGIPGIGPKTAQELIHQFGSLENLYSKVEEIPRESLKEKIRINRESAFLSRELVALRTDVPLPISISELSKKPMDTGKIIQLFQELEFNRFLQELPSFVTETPGSRRNDRIVQSEEELKELTQTLSSLPMFAIDLETTSLSFLSAEIVGFSFSWKEGEAVYIPVLLPETHFSDDLFSTPKGTRLELVLHYLKPILENPRIRKCGQNIKYDLLVLRQHGVELQGIDFDTMIAAYVLNPGARHFNLDALALEYLNFQKIPTKSLIGSGSKQRSMAEVELEKIAEYACEDAETVYRLRAVLEPKLKETGMESLFREIEMPLVKVLAKMEENGVYLDTSLFSKLSKEMEKELDQLRKEIYALAGEEFNINSTQELGKILFEKLKIHELVGWKKPKKTKTGYATDVSVLESLSVHPLPKKLLDYRQLAKLKSTYVDALPELIHPKTGRLHASFNQTVAATGRLSSSNPNLQNIPIRTELGKEIRKAFIPEKEGWVILSADYNQIELRLMAHLAQDQTLIESYHRGEDVHLRTACEVFGIAPEQVTDELRRQAKTINFGIMYGMGPYGLAQRLGISQEEAQRFITAYFARYPKVNEYIFNTIAFAHKHGYVTTLFGRKRFIPELRSENRTLREFGERMAINTPIQGTAADLIKIAMIRISDAIEKSGLESKMILQIHDELVFEVPKREVKMLSEIVKKEMEEVIALSVPIKVDIGVGANWCEAHE